MSQPTYPHDIEKAYVWWTERDKIAIAYLDSSTAIYPENFSSPSEDDAGYKYAGATGRVYSAHEDHDDWTFRMHVVRKARKNGGASGEELSAITDSPEFPEQFHEALVNKVIQHGYEKTGDVNMLNVAKYWERKYLDKVHDGIIYASKDRVGGFKRMLGSF